MRRLHACHPTWNSPVPASAEAMRRSSVVLLFLPARSIRTSHLISRALNYQSTARSPSLHLPPLRSKQHSARARPSWPKEVRMKALPPPFSATRQSSSRASKHPLLLRLLAVGLLVVLLGVGARSIRLSWRPASQTSVARPGESQGSHRLLECVLTPCCSHRTHRLPHLLSTSAAHQPSPHPQLAPAPIRRSFSHNPLPTFLRAVEPSPTHLPPPSRSHDLSLTRGGPRTRLQAPSHPPRAPSLAPIGSASHSSRRRPSLYLLAC
jgi:hypothetical protein